MYTVGFVELSSTEEIVNHFFPAIGAATTASFSAAKEAFPRPDMYSVKFQIKSVRAEENVLLVLGEFESLENVISTTREDLEKKKRFSIYPASAEKDEFVRFVKLLSEIFKSLEDVRFLIFYKLHQQNLVADVAISEGKFFLKTRLYNSMNNEQFYRQCLTEAPEDTDLKNLWYEETLEYCLSFDDIIERRRNIALLTQISPGEKRAEAEASYANAMCEFKCENELLAMSYLHHAIQIDPEHFDSLEQLATQYFHRKNYDNALPYYERAIKLIPDGGRDMQARRIECLITLNRSGELPSAIIDLVDFTPVSDSRWLVLFLKKFRDQKRADLALLGLREVIEQYENRLLDDRNDREEVTELTESLCFAYIHLAYTDYTLGNKDRAISYTEKVINVYQWDNGAAHRMRATILLEQKRIEELAEEVEILKILEGNYSDTLILEGGLLILRKEYDRALDAYKRSVEIDPSNCYVGYFGIGHALAWMRKDVEAIPYFRKSLDIKPDQARCLSDLGSSLSNIGEREEAIACLDRAIALQPSYYHPYYVRGCIAALEGNLEESHQWLVQAVACDRSIILRLREESDLRSLRNFPAFRDLIR